MLGWEVIPRIPLGDFSVSPHGVGIAVGYFIGATLMARRARRTGFDEDHAWNAAVVGVLGAIVGARTAYVVGHSDQFERPIEYLQIYRGGISLVGGLMGGFLAAWLYTRAKKLDFARLADLGAPGLAIGTAVGRIGDLVIGDHLGKPTNGFWGWEYRGGELISSPPCLQGGEPVYPSANGCIEPGMVVHQTALYDAVWALVIFLILVRLDRKPRPKGFLVWTWAALYAAGRIVTDFTRVDKTWFGTGMTGSQLTAIAVLLLALAALARLRRAPVGATVAAGAGTAAAEPVHSESPEAQKPPVAEELAGAGDTSESPEAQEPPVAEETAATGQPEAGGAQEPPVAEELAGAGDAEETPAAQEPPVAEGTAGTGDLDAPEPQTAVAPVLVPAAGLDLGEGPAAESGPVKDRAAGAEPAASDPAVQGERVAEGEAEAPQAPEAVPALEPVLEEPEPASDEDRRDAPQEP